MSDALEGTPLIAPSSTDHPLYEGIVNACRSVFDPEIPVNIYDLGLIYTININAESEVRIIMSLTAPGCPVAGEMPGWVADAVLTQPHVWAKLKLALKTQEIVIENPYSEFSQPGALSLQPEKIPLRLGYTRF